MDWLSNPWLVGIIGGIPSGLLVNWVSGYLLGKRENREYLQKVIGANREVIVAIRPGIAEGHVPSRDILGALANATARRYGVDAGDLYTPEQIAEELVKEVMDSSFISSTQKAEYCSRLAALDEPPAPLVARIVSETEARPIAEYRQRVIASMSMLLGILTAAIGFMYPVVDTLRGALSEKSLGGMEQPSVEVLLSAVAALGTVLMTLLAFTAFRDVDKRRRRRAPLKPDLRSEGGSPVGLPDSGERPADP